MATAKRTIPATKAASDKPVAKKATAKKPAEKMGADKPGAKKAAAKKPAAKTTPAKKAASTQAAVRKPAAKTAANPAPAKPAAGKAPAKASSRSGRDGQSSDKPAGGGATAFAALKQILKRHERALVVVHDVADHYYLDTRTLGPNKKPLFFGAVRAGKAYTSFYLMPVYADPALLDGMSPALKKRMQGKSCFNFKAAEPELFGELGRLTARCFEHWKKSGRI